MFPLHVSFSRELESLSKQHRGWPLNGPLKSVNMGSCRMSPEPGLQDRAACGSISLTALGKRCRQSLRNAASAGRGWLLHSCTQLGAPGAPPSVTSRALGLWEVREQSCASFLEGELTSGDSCILYQVSNIIAATMQEDSFTYTLQTWQRQWCGAVQASH